MRALIWLAVATVGAGLVTACKDTNKPEERENLAPNANFSFQCPALRCDFEDTSTDDGEIVSWNWNFGGAGSAQRRPFHMYEAAGSYAVSLTVTDNDGATSTVSKMVDPKDPVVSSLVCVDGSAPGGFVACTLKLQEQAGFKVVLDASSCEAHGNIFRITAPEPATLTQDGCYETAAKQLVFVGPFSAGTEIKAEVVAPQLAERPRLVVQGAYPVWTLTYEDGADADFNDLQLTLSALPTGN
jgi:hypothetical protein